MAKRRGLNLRDSTGSKPVLATIMNDIDKILDPNDFSWIKVKRFNEKDHGDEAVYHALFRISSSDSTRHLPQIMEPNNMKYVLIVSALLFTGCGSTDYAKIEAQNKEHLATEGYLVGKLPDGRTVTRYKVETGSNPDHWIYVTNNTITINRSIEHSDGENSTTYHYVEVMIDGVPYVPKHKAK